MPLTLRPSRVRVHHGCPACGYDLSGQSESVPVCPECGERATFTPIEVQDCIDAWVGSRGSGIFNKGPAVRGHSAAWGPNSVLIIAGMFLASKEFFGVTPLAAPPWLILSAAAVLWIITVAYARRKVPYGMGGPAVIAAHAVGGVGVAAVVSGVAAIWWLVLSWTPALGIVCLVAAIALWWARGRLIERMRQWLLQEYRRRN